MPRPRHAAPADPAPAGHAPADHPPAGRPRITSPRRWAVVPAAVAPVAMIGGWLLAEAVAPGFDPVRRTISELATADVPHPGVMTAGLLVTGVAHVVTASGLVGLPRTGRLGLALGGVATAAVGLLPLDRAPHAHGIAAGVAFGALALWPAASVRRDGPSPLRPAVLAPATAVLLGLLGWFVAEAVRAGLAEGLAERAVAGAESLAPLVLVVALLSRRRAESSLRLGAAGGLRG
ncbi:DUF998 domain-containing protein [Cellulomonas sp. ACRRI]|uniref:DUF998 domain-containing protein n=1 Tax=Cellulomonas sp. ACRRI TaxID=2918188 RepID=UPI001EF30A8F|nr:DUF998 domain-containing protein [Cellulomonas sp. ACRRI]MCG7284512.1 DUF998 domain-containing protein [Cellulomonas sp. ACRRI]